MTSAPEAHKTAGVLVADLLTLGREIENTHGEEARKLLDAAAAALSTPSVPAVAELSGDGLPQPIAGAAEDETDNEADGQWRTLALQFDAHRIEALSWLKAMVGNYAEDHWAGAVAFLAAPPLSGERVLAERIAALDLPPSVDDPDAGHAVARTEDGGEVETFDTIAAWVEETFGRSTFERRLERAGEELAEAQDAPPEKRVEEIADVITCLIGAASKADGNLWQAITSKMKVNRARQWAIREDGSGYHVQDTRPSPVPAASKPEGWE